MSVAEPLACPQVGECSVEVDRETCLFVSKGPQFLFTNDRCTHEHLNATLYAFKFPTGYNEWFVPYHFFWTRPGYCKYFDMRGWVYLVYRNAWLITGVERKGYDRRVVYLQHGVTKKLDSIAYTISGDTLQPDGGQGIISTVEILNQVERKAPTRENPVAIVARIGDIRPSDGKQEVVTLDELRKRDEEQSYKFGRPLEHRATCVYPSLRKVCKTFNENNGECQCHLGYTGTFCNIDVNECDQLPCGHGNCRNTYGSYECQCDDGWVGKNCDEDVNECNYPHICGSKGTCKNTEGSYECLCPTGLIGEHCDTDFEECKEQPSLCQPHGKCIDIFGSYICHCDPGWTGSNCEKDLDECKSGEVVCFNGGTCINTDGSYTCTCTQKWTGKQCREEVDHCLNLACVNGLCVLKGDGVDVECKCFRGWTGADCNTDRNECEEKKDLCLNGMCSDPSGNYTCTCNVGYTGKHCEKDINECADAKCINGYCIDMQGKHSCTCYPGFTGERCTDKISVCKYLAFDCVNGTCVSDGKVPRCRCSEGYTGLHCEIRISKCELNPCVHGYCMDGKRVNEFNCICRDGYAGVDCSVDENPCVPSPCQNDAPCLINKTSPYQFSCGCKKGYSGHLCEQGLSSGGLSARRSIIQITVVVLLVFAFHEWSVVSGSWSSLSMLICVIMN